MRSPSLFPTSKRGKKKSMMAFVLAKYVQIEAPSASRVQDVLLVPSPQLLALLWKERRRKKDKKKRPLREGENMHCPLLCYTQ